MVNSTPRPLYPPGKTRYPLHRRVGGPHKILLGWANLGGEVYEIWGSQSGVAEDWSLGCECCAAGCIEVKISATCHLLTPWSSYESNRSSPSQEIPAFYGTRTFITAFTSVRHLSISWARSIQSILPTHFLKIHLNIILPSTPGPSKWSLSHRFPHHNPIYTSPLPHTCCMPRPFHSRFDHRTILGKEYRPLSSSLYSFLRSPFTSALLSPNILLNTLFSNTLSLRSSLNGDQISHPYKTKGKIVVLYIVTFKFWGIKLEDKRFCTEWY